jgi:hypothetical protein
MSANQPNGAINAVQASPAKKTRKARRTADQILANAVAAAEAKRLKMLETAQKKANELAEKAAQKEAERQAKEQAKKTEKERLKQEAAVARAAKKAQNDALVGIGQLMNNALPLKPAATRRKARTLNEQMRNLQAKQAEQAQKAEARKAATAARQAERKAAAAAAKAQKAAQEVMVAHAVEEVAHSSPLMAAIAASPKKTRKRITANNIMAKAQANAAARALQMADPALKKNPRRKTAEQILANAVKKANALRLKEVGRVVPPPKARVSRKKKNNYDPNAENAGWRYF